MGEGGCSPEYFLNKMQWWEVQRYINGIRRRERTAWATTRQHAFWILRSLGAKIDTASDLLPLPWEKNKESEKSEPNEEDIQRALDIIAAENAKNNKA